MRWERKISFKSTFQFESVHACGNGNRFDENFLWFLCEDNALGREGRFSENGDAAG